MPQEIRVLCCFKCYMYQVDIVKKSNKWKCKLCGAQQSVKQVFHRGTGQECRLKAQQLNEKKISIEKQNSEYLDNFDWSEEEDFEESCTASESENSNHVESAGRSSSKWEKYCEEDEDEENILMEGKRTHTLDATGKDAKRKSLEPTPDESCNKKSKWGSFV